MARNLINVEKEKQTFFDLETVKKVKKRNAHSRICNMARKMKVMENETQTKCDLEYGKKH